MEINECVNECLSCPQPRCETGCPVHNEICSFIKCLKEEDLDAASIILYNVNTFPELTSRLCDCDRQCQGHCVKGIKSNPVQIQRIERYISDHRKFPYKPLPSNGKKIALIGAGVACLSAAIRLRENGYEVDVYEQYDQIGGAIYSGIPSYRFDKSILNTIQNYLEDMNVTFYFHQQVGKDITLEELLEKYDRILIGIGAQVENKYGLEGNGYLAGLSLLYDLNVKEMHFTYKEKYHHAIVWGGGNVAMDCARSLIRIMDDVTVLYRRSEKEMPANQSEIQDAKNEGVKFALLENIQSLNLDEEGNVIGARCVKMELGEPDESGRRSPHVIEGSEYDIPCDLVVAAIGQKVDLSPLGEISIQKTHETSIPNVYLAGDAYLGPGTVASAIRDGQDCAKEIMDSFE